MKLEIGLQKFLNKSIEESRACTVEGSFSRMLTVQEINYINGKLKRYGYLVKCFRCETCEEYSNGEEPFHIERAAI